GGRDSGDFPPPPPPRHDHFPPGYPAALALLWRASGVSVPAAHALSCLGTVVATLGTWWWLRRLYPPRTAFLLGLALACNWAWGRIGGGLPSGAPVLGLATAVLLVTIRIPRRS